jgi:hypothetical protein
LSFSVPGIRLRLPRRGIDAVIAAALALLAGVLYHRTLGFWWSDDDFFNLHFLSTFGPGEIAFDPEVWRRLPFRMLTPLLFLSLQLDRALGGLAPGAFYLHQLAVLGLATGVLYRVLRLWLPVAWALFGATLFLLGPPIASLPPLLAVRHYLEAVLFGLLATGAFVLAVRRRSTGWAVASAALGIVAMAAKEIAVPLPAFLLLLPDGSRRDRLRAAVPHAVALVVYAVYRVWMLGTPVGGYGWAPTAGSWPRVALALPGRIAAEFAGHSAAGVLLLLAVLAGLGLAALAGRQSAGRLAAALLLALLPVLPVAHEVAARYAVTAWLVATIALAAAGARLTADDGLVGQGLRRRRRRRVACALAAAALAGGLLAWGAAWSREVARAERKAAENRFAFEMTAGDLLRQPLNPPASLRELGWLRSTLRGQGPAGGWFYDDLYLSTPAAADKRVWSYDPDSRRIGEVTARVPALVVAHRGLQRDVPLSADFSTGTVGGPIIDWRLGPYEEGRWAFVFGDGLEVVEVPRQAGFQRRVTTVALKIRYTSPEGWLSYSPELALDFTTEPEARWSR